MGKDLFIKDDWITCFYINESHVIIRGIKFLGYYNPITKYYPITRFNKAKTDLIVETFVSNTISIFPDFEEGHCIRVVCVLSNKTPSILD